MADTQPKMMIMMKPNSRSQTMQTRCPPRCGWPLTQPLARLLLRHPLRCMPVEVEPGGGRGGSQGGRDC
jgi:hypothetical protein